jgi:hypothetical protein
LKDELSRFLWSAFTHARALLAVLDFRLKPSVLYCDFPCCQGLVSSSVFVGLVCSGVVVLGAARVFCPFECIVRFSLKFSLGARVEPAFQFLNVEI